MPELLLGTSIDEEPYKGFDMNIEQTGANMAFSGTQALLLWCRQQTESYSEVNVINMTTSWRDGLAFCAIIHHFRPDLIDFDRLSKENIMVNNELAFTVAEKHLGIPMVLDATDMLENTIPDKLSVITYVSQLYEYFKNRSPADQGYATKMNVQPKARTESKGHKGSKRTSPSNQIYILSGHAKRVASALRNVFKSDAKEESSKSKEHGKYLGVDPLRTNLETSRNSSDESSPGTARKSPFLGNDCCICHKRVYIMERLIVERKLFHRACFRCDKCNACLRPGTYHYFLETEKFCCLFDCGGGKRETPIKIKLEPMSDVAHKAYSQKNSPTKSSTDNSHVNDSPGQEKSSLQRQFSIVKRNTIRLNALPQPLGKETVAKSQKHTHSSKKPSLSQHRSKGEKKRRFSGSGRGKGKGEGKGKYVSSQDHEQISWSPEHKRRAPETQLRNGMEEKVHVTGVGVNKEEIIKGSIPSSTQLDLVSKEKEGIVDKSKESLFSKEDEEKITREDSVYEKPTENLFFSFKEELLKRAAVKDELLKRTTFKEELLKRAAKSELNDDGSKAKTDAKIADKSKLLENDCKPSLVTSLQGGYEAKINDNVLEKIDFLEDREKRTESNLQEEDRVTDSETKHSYERKYSDASVNSDSTRGSGSRKGSILGDIDPSVVVPKSVQKLREKFLNINDLIDEKHKTIIARKSSEMQRELKCISAWKQQTDSQVTSSRKLSANLAGKTAETRRPNVSSNRRSVKELRKMYMGSEGGKEKASDEIPFRVRSKSMKAKVNMERKTSAPETKAISSGTKKTEPENKGENLGSSENADDESEESLSKRSESLNTNDNVVVIHVDNSQENRQGDNQMSESAPSSKETNSMPQKTLTYKVIKSEGVANDIPLLQVQPASPEPSTGDRSSPGLKRHAASHDSGIDMPLYAQNNVPDEKVSGESLKVSTVLSTAGNESPVLTPNEQLSNTSGTDVQPPQNSLPPERDYSPVEVSWTLPLTVGSTGSLTDTSSSCSSPRMSVVIAQEASSTKINSRFFTVETMEPWDFEEYRIAEEHQCVMEVEGEFSFGKEKSKTSKAEREAITSLHRDAKNGGYNDTDLIKEDEITLSLDEIDLELQALETQHRILERRGVDIEHILRETMGSADGDINEAEEELLREWLGVVHKKNRIMRRESELIYLLQSHNYEERYRTVEGELRKLVAMRDEVKSSDDLKRERELLSELLELVQKRSFIVDSLEEERVREIQEDEKVEQALTDGIAALPDNCWDQRPDYTKVAFSRFYC